MAILRRIVDAVKGKAPLSASRSPEWPATRKAHLADHPQCEVCGGTKSLEVHHILPFHLHPELELDDKNLITLCESDENGVNCHLFFGHLGDFHSYNCSVVSDSPLWREKLRNRP
jgi:hypothetical protein